MNVSSPLLQGYAKKHGVNWRLKTKEETSEEYVDALIESLGKEPIEKQASFNTDLEDIDSISTTKGCECLLAKARDEDESFDEKVYDELSNMKERALYFYLHYNELFDQVLELYDLEAKQGWRGRKTAALPIESVHGNLQDLVNALKSFYGKESRGKNLKIKPVVKVDRVTYVAYIEDILTNDLTFNGDKLESETPRRPVFMAYFRYRPVEGILEVKGEGGKEHVTSLQHLFIKHFLKTDPMKHLKPIRYNFEKIRDLKTLEFPVTTQDRIDSVTLKGLHIVHNEKTVNLSIDIASDPNRQGVGPMRERLQKMNIDLAEYEVRKFKIQVIFKQGKGRRERVTVAVTYPDVCDLKDREIDNTVRKLLKKWDLDLF